MKTTRIVVLIFILSIVGFGSLAKPHTAGALPSSFPITGYAWSENIGWVDLNCSNTAGLCSTSPFGLTIDASGNITGYAWSENIGWISANPADLAGCPQAPCTATITSGGAMNGWMKVLSADGYNTSASTQYSTTTYSVPVPVSTIFATVGVNPTGLAFDSSGNLYVANQSSNTISKVTPDGTVTTFASGFTGPRGIVFDSSGNLFVANQGGTTISKITPAGAVSTFATVGSDPKNLAFDSAGNLYAVNNGGTTVSKVTPAGAVSTFATVGSSPADLIFNSSGNLYVANNGSNTISKITPAGGVFTFSSSGFNGPRGLALDSSGNLYVANQGTGGTTVSKVTPAGAVSTFATVGAQPMGLIFDSAGNLYVTNAGGTTVSEVTPAGAVSTYATVGATPGVLIFDSAGNLYVSNNGSGTVSKVTPSTGTQSYVVPTGATSITATLVGGGGATTTTTVTVTPSETLFVTMGPSSGQTTLKRGATTLVSGSGELILVSSTIIPSGSVGWFGFISLSGTSPSYGVTETGGAFSGYSWSDDVMGWTDWHYASTTYGTCTPSYSCSGSQITYTNSSCVTSNYGAMCASPAFCSSGSSSCLYPSPSVNPGGALTVSPKLVPVGKTTQVSWNISNVVSCTTTGTNGDSWSGLSGTKTSKAINAQTTYTLSCIPDDPSAPVFTQSVTLNLVPTYRER